MPKVQQSDQQVTMRTKAIIIKKQNTNEYDQLVTCYTREFGKLTAIAKSVLKPSSIQAMHLDILNLVDFELVEGRSMPIITGAHSENNYRGIKNSVPLTAGAYFFAEVLDKMVPDSEKDENLWNFTVEVLEKLDRTVKPENLLIFLKQKQFYLLKLLGWADGNINVADMDNIFEATAEKRFKSLDFLYQVINS